MKLIEFTINLLQECEVEDTEHFHCKDEGCETVFRLVLSLQIYKMYFSKLITSVGPWDKDLSQIKVLFKITVLFQFER